MGCKQGWPPSTLPSAACRSAHLAAGQHAQREKRSVTETAGLLLDSHAQKLGARPRLSPLLSPLLLPGRRTCAGGWARRRCLGARIGSVNERNCMRVGPKQHLELPQRDGLLEVPQQWLVVGIPACRGGGAAVGGSGVPECLEPLEEMDCVVWFEQPES